MVQGAVCRVGGETLVRDHSACWQSDTSLLTRSNPILGSRSRGRPDSSHHNQAFACVCFLFLVHLRPQAMPGTPRGIQELQLPFGAFLLCITLTPPLTPTAPQKIWDPNCVGATTLRHGLPPATSSSFFLRRASYPTSAMNLLLPGRQALQQEGHLHVPRDPDRHVPR